MKSKLAAGILLVLVILGAWKFRSEGADFDQICYAGIAYELVGYSPVESHSLAYQQLRKGVSEQLFRTLTGQVQDEDFAKYRSRMYTDQTYFTNQLPLYKGRVAYVGILAAGIKIGVPPRITAIFLTLSAMVCFGLGLLFLTSEFLGGVALTLVPASAIAISSIYQLMAMTPDVIVAATFVWVAYLSFIKPRYFWVVTLVAVSILFRPDTVLTSIFPLAMTMREKSWARLSASLVLFSCSYLFASKTLGAAPLSQSYWAVLATGIEPTGSGFPPISAIKPQLLAGIEFLVDRMWWAPLGLICGYLTYKRHAVVSITLSLIAACGLLRFLLLPSGIERFYVQYSSLAFVLVATLVADHSQRSGNNDLSLSDDQLSQAESK